MYRVAVCVLHFSCAGVRFIRSADLCVWVWVKRVRNVGSATFIVSTGGWGGGVQLSVRLTPRRQPALWCWKKDAPERDRHTELTQIKGNLSLNRGTRSWPTNIWQRAWTGTKKLLRNLLYSPEMQLSQRVSTAARSHVCKLHTWTNRWMDM
jgi:hypothetical protein